MSHTDGDRVTEKSVLWLVGLLDSLKCFLYFAWSVEISYCSCSLNMLLKSNTTEDFHLSIFSIMVCNGKIKMALLRKQTVIFPFAS